MKGISLSLAGVIPVILVPVLTPSPVYGQKPAPFPQKLEQEGFRSVIARTGNLFIAGQPDERAFQWLKEQGVTTVVNLRTQSEMDNRQYIPFDENELVDSLGMKYVHIPQGDDEHPYSPEAVKRFVQVMENSDGKILLHCTVAWRASHLWVAYLVHYLHMDVMEAISHGKEINFGTLPLEGFMGGDMQISF